MNTQKENPFFENLVIVAIVLVLVHTFIEDLAVVLAWSWELRRILLFLGFAFDLFFTIEFLARLYFAASRGAAADYFVRNRGWIDFLASVPLLLLNSGPAVYAIVSGSAPVVGMVGFLNVLKVVKAIRIARILRLLRVLKIFRKIKHADSVMAQRHVSRITALSVSVFVFGLLAFTIVTTLLNAPSVDQAFQERNLDLVRYIEQEGLANPADADRLEGIAGFEHSVLLVKEAGRTRYSRFDNETYRREFGPGDYGYLESGEVGLFVDLRTLNAEQARNNLLYFVVIVAMVGAILFFYSPQFALTVSDPVHIMRRGMAEKAYNLEVKIPERLKQDEVYKLAALYNEVYLPLKDRSGGDDDSGILDLKMEDLGDIFETDTPGEQ
jgi:hypothetical protein